ncbi:MAG TPA: hypothetical protein VF041_05820 [Gemmatimonadaceae bacterium]
MSAEALEAALEALGVHGRVEVRGKLAIVTVRDAAALRDPAVRERAVAAAQSHGFTNLALELGHDGDAPLSGD